VGEEWSAVVKDSTDVDLNQLQSTLVLLDAGPRPARRERREHFVLAASSQRSSEASFVRQTAAGRHAAGCGKIGDGLWSTKI
jgi:hypothetical protein